MGCCYCEILQQYETGHTSLDKFLLKAPEPLPHLSGPQAPSGQGPCAALPIAHALIRHWEPQKVILVLSLSLEQLQGPALSLEPSLGCQEQTTQLLWVNINILIIMCAGVHTSQTSWPVWQHIQHSLPVDLSLTPTISLVNTTASKPPYPLNMIKIWRMWPDVGKHMRLWNSLLQFRYFS